MSWLVSAKQYIPAVIGEPFGGGYFAGYISHTADGNPTHALIVAPRATGATGTNYELTTNLLIKTTDTTTANTGSPFDGAANTAAMIADDVSTGVQNHPAAQFCDGLSIGGFTDWYLPARYELDIAYFNLKPTTQANNTLSGSNIYSVPRRNSNNTASYPTQTTLTAFNTSAEAFTPLQHCASTESGVNSWTVEFDSGRHIFRNKTSGIRSLRAFRRIAL